MTELSAPIRDLADYAEWAALAEREGWSDGLPLAPPTVAAVEAVVTYLGREPGEVIGSMPPRGGRVTVEQVAINSVMAGCPPAVVPVVIAAIEAILAPEFDLLPASVTTNGSAPLVIVGGPAVERLGFNASYGSFAGGAVANASVGRALRLALRNIGGAIPGDGSNVVHGHPGWFSYCIAEARTPSPWPLLHVRRGFAPETSCVTVFFCQAPFALYVPGSAQRILNVVGASLAVPGVNMYFGAGQILLAFSPKPAQELARAGYHAEDVQRWVWEHARFELGALRRAGVFETEAHTFYWGARNPAPALDGQPDSARLPLVDGPEDIHVVVTGAAGQWWISYCPGWGEFGGYAVTRSIVEPGASA